MYKYPLLFLLLLVLIYSCNTEQPFELSGSTWSSQSDEFCLEQYTFYPEMKLKAYDCVLEGYRTGTYQINKDTVIVEIYHADNTPPFAGGTGELMKRFQYKLLIKENVLEQFYFKDFRHDSELKDDALFRRVNK